MTRLPVELVAPAKLTWSLRITGVRDDGHHLLDAEMVTVDLADTIRLEEGDGLAVTGPFGHEVADVDAAENLVTRALALAGRTARAIVDKQIPTAAGLGGGSADGAAVLRWADRTDPEIAARLGADVPFCVVGGRARVRGIGEQVEPLPPRDLVVTVVTPPERAATAAVYAAWDELGGPVGEAGNDLEPAALSVMPGLAGWRDRVGDATGQRPRLAGSGSSWFVEGDHVGALHEVARRGGARLLRRCRTGGPASRQ